MGLSSSSGEWCRHSDCVLEGFPWCRKIMDDILIWVTTPSELESRLNEVIKRCEDLHFLLGGAAPTLCWGRKGGTPAQSWLGIVRATGSDTFRHCLHPNTHLHYMPQCEVTPAGFANCSIRRRITMFFFLEKVVFLCAEVKEGAKEG